jgi:hypothetical protein
MTLAVAAAPTWQARAQDSPDGITLSYTCPRCGGANQINLQAPPWTVPSDPDVYPALGSEDGHLHPRHAELERQRATGALAHEPRDEVATQLWCHRCAHGTDAVIRVFDDE